MPKIQTTFHTILEYHNLKRPDDLSRLTDTEIIVVPGVGRASLSRIREIYSFDWRAEAENLQKRLHDALVEIKRLNRLREEVTYLGSINNVTSVRLAPEECAVLIGTSDHDILFPIHLIWNPYIDKPNDLAAFGFGDTSNDGKLIALGVALPELRRVENVTLNGPTEFDDFYTYSIIIETSIRPYEAKLFREKTLEP